MSNFGDAVKSVWGFKKSKIIMVVGIFFCTLSLQVLANNLRPSALPKQGSCPSGYATSGNYCSPMPNASFAVPKIGGCPSGYSTSGNYCLAVSANTKFAMPKAGSCPSGYSTSGNYCLSIN